MTADRGGLHAAPAAGPEAGLVIDRLVGLERARWSGWFRVLAGGELVGFGRMAGGRLGWALAREQGPALADLLVRLGGVTPAAIEAVRAAAPREVISGFVPALAEAGLVPAPVLRRAVQLHLRAVLAALGGLQGVEVELRESGPAADLKLLFTLGELMPDLDPPQAAGPVLEAAPGAAEQLAPLAELPGFLAGTIADAEGRALAALSRSVGVEGRTLAALQGLGRPAFLVVGAERGTLVARWVEGPVALLVSVLVADESRIGLAKHRLGAVAPAVAAWAAAASGVAA